MHPLPLTCLPSYVYALGELAARRVVGSACSF
jgi:hypothetical protein